MRKYIPNALTISRFPSGIGILLAHHYGMMFEAVLIASYAFTTDWFDGRLARRWKVESNLGAKLDPYADKTVCWAMVIVLLREIGFDYAVIVVPMCIFAVYDIGLAVLRLFFWHLDVQTNWYAKAKTMALMAGLFILSLGVLIEPNSYAIAEFFAQYIPHRLLAEYVTDESVQLIAHLTIGLGLVSLWLAAVLAIPSAVTYLSRYGQGLAPRVHGAP